ncbi:hypothetical protein [Legionella bozemanae]|uniref:hypothetical protein n=1 Tax=Legionella bozemanae TaxID=447 RepID=UPI00399C79F6
MAAKLLDGEIHPSKARITIVKAIVSEHVLFLKRQRDYMICVVKSYSNKKPCFELRHRCISCWWVQSEQLLEFYRERREQRVEPELQQRQSEHQQ